VVRNFKSVKHLNTLS